MHALVAFLSVACFNTVVGDVVVVKIVDHVEILKDTVEKYQVMLRLD